MNTAITATDAHWLVAGDFQAALADISPIQSLIDMGFCFDTGDPINVQPRQATYMGGKGTVIDHIIASKAWWHLWQSGGRLPLTTFPTHYPVQVSWKLPTRPPSLQRCCLPHRLPAQCLLPSPAELSPEWPGLPQPDHFQSLLQSDVDEAFKCWSQRWEQHLLERATTHSDLPPLSSRHKGRGQGWPWKDPPEAVEAPPLAQASAQTRSLRELYSLLVMAEQQWHSEQGISESLQVRISRLWMVHSSFLDAHLAFDADIRAAKLLVKACLHDSEALDQQLRRSRWQSSLMATSNAASARAFAAIKAPERHALIAWADSSGQIIAHPDAQAKLIETFWHTVIGELDPTTPGMFPQHIIDQLPRAPHWRPPPITCTSLVSTLSAMKNGSAAGVDGWRVEELKSIPAQGLMELCQLLAVCETTGRMPALWAHALISLVPKVSDVPQIHQLRPISVYSTIWRTYSKLRCSQLALHLETVLHHWQYGARVGRSPLNPINAIGFHLDNARLGHGPPIFGISLDIVKMCDTIPHNVVRQLLQVWNIDEVSASFWMKHFESSQHCYKLSGNYVTPTRGASRGLGQGCALSVMAANCVMSALAHVLEHHLDQPDQVLGSIFIDDLHIISTQAYHLQIIADYTQALLRPLGMAIAKGKSAVWTTDHEVVRPGRWGPLLVTSHKAIVLGS